MTDQNMPADKVRKIASEMRDAMRREDDGYPYVEFLSDMGDYIRDLEALLPAPARPTMADMTEEERRECQWMQCDVETWDRAVIILPSAGGSRTMTLDWKGHVTYEPHSKVTPRPDLPRLQWPGDTLTSSRGRPSTERNLND